MMELLNQMKPLDYVYLLVGIILFIFSILSFLDKEHKHRIGTWIILAYIQCIFYFLDPTCLKKSMAGS